MDNNVDFAEAMKEVCREAVKTRPANQPITWDELDKALDEYIKTETHEVLKARERKDKPFG